VGLSVIAASLAAGACAEESSPIEESPDGGVTRDPIDAAVLPDDDAAVLVDAGFDASDGSVPYVPEHFDINHVLGTGQSLSVGAAGIPALSTTQPYANTMFVTGVRAGATGLTSFVPLVESTPAANPAETLNSSFANLVARISREVVLVGQPNGKNSHDLLLSAHGVGGTAYVGLKKGTAPFAAGIAQVNAAKLLAAAAGKTYVVRAVTNVHGESDHVAKNATYQANLLEWQKDYETDVKAITGQTITIPMFQTQVSSWTKYGQAESAIPAQQLGAHLAAPGKVVLVGPKYHLAYSADGVHLSNKGYQHMGEDYAKAYRRVVLEGKAWEPLRPQSITRAGRVITVKLVVPAPPLVLDTTRVTNPGNYGFAYTDDSNAPPTIESVALAGPDTLTITLSAAPAATTTKRALRYAYTGTVGALGGPTTGPRGNLRDSDATPSRGGYELFNWCVHFDEAVP